MKKEIAREFRERIVESFLDFLILTKLAKNRSMSADNLMNFIDQKVKVSLNPGLIYSHLFHLEQDRLIRRAHTRSEKVYKITQKGKRKIDISRKYMSATQWAVDQMLRE